MTDHFSSGHNRTPDPTGDDTGLLLDKLNPEQQEAVRHAAGPLLILAGAGSGKTRVITQRIAFLIRERGVAPSRILAITFTNKAAAEMKERIGSLIGPRMAGMWVGTFHSMLLRILRQHADRIGFTRDFVILDTDDQQRLLRECIQNANLDEKTYPYRQIHSQISSLKNDLVDPETYAGTGTGGDFRRAKTAQLFSAYQSRLRQSNAMDFDDILVYAVHLLQEHPDVLAHYQDRFEYILVDEYQDTNHAQYTLVRLLSGKRRNLCVVGDDDQSIYSFRGANIRNILDFEKDFPDCKVIKLERNYRSTGHVLMAANSVIRNNRGRKDKKLWTDTGEGEPVTFLLADTHYEEALYVAGEINRLVTRTGAARYRDIAILYRLNALSRSLEAALREYSVPYRIYGGTRFYDRREIKDVMAYLRLVLIPEDDLSFIRVINNPRRGIGETTIDQLRAEADLRGISLLAMSARAEEAPSLSRAAARLTLFAGVIADLRGRLSHPELSFRDYIEQVQERSGLLQALVDQQEKSKDNDPVDRIENMKELLSDALEFENGLRTAVSGIPDTTLYPEDRVAMPEDNAGLLRLYLERAALYSEVDELTEEDDSIRLMTIHSAKGLEFDTVFLVGAEEGLFPGYRSIGSEQDIEEERRLAYVAITRAKRKLIITSARQRLLFGQTQSLMVSRFVQEIDPAHLEEIGGKRGRTDSSGARRAGVGETDGTGFGRAGLSIGSSARGFVGADAFASRGLAAAGRQKPPVQSRQDNVSDAGGLDPLSIRKGDLVVHPRFGRGRVQTAEPVAGDAILVVEFETAGIKRMLARQAKLTKP